MGLDERQSTLGTTNYRLTNFASDFSKVFTYPPLRGGAILSIRFNAISSQFSLFRFYRLFLFIQISLYYLPVNYK